MRTKKNTESELRLFGGTPTFLLGLFFFFFYLYAKQKLRIARQYQGTQCGGAFFQDFNRISFVPHILVVGWLVGLCRRAERPRRVRAEVPCGGFARVVSPPLTSSQRVLSVDSSRILIFCTYMPPTLSALVHVPMCAYPFVSM